MDLTQAIPGPEVTLVSPRVIAAYAALMAAATLGVLYLYRGRSFIVYWIGAWLMFTASPLLNAQGTPTSGCHGRSSASRCC